MKSIKYIGLFLLGILGISHSAFAHVGYVITHDQLEQTQGFDWGFLLQPFSNIYYIGLMIGTIIVFSCIWYGLIKSKKVVMYFSTIKERLMSYHEFVPWILRLSLGIALLGAGTEHVLVSPLLAYPGLAVLEIVLGFLFLLGFLITPATIVTLGIYVFALSKNIYLIGNLDMFALALSVLVFHSPRPGLDDMLGISLLQKISIKRQYIAPVVRIGLGTAMIYLALFEKILNPHMSALVVSQYHLQQFINVSPAMWVLATGLIEFIIGVCIITGFKTRIASVIAFIVISMTFFYFKESVTSHITLFGGLSILAIEGGGLWSIDQFLIARKNRILHTH